MIWTPVISARENHGLRGYILVGKAGLNTPFEKIHQFVEMLYQSGIVCQMEEIPEAGHIDVWAFEGGLVRALDFVNQPRS